MSGPLQRYKVQSAELFVGQTPTYRALGDEGAICTGDGRKLSNSLNFTVSGPGQ